MTQDIEFKRLQWHCRRGMLELDVLLRPYLDACYADLDAHHQAEFQRLLACEDQDLYIWFTQRIEPEDPGLRDMVNRILTFAQP